MMRTFWGIFLLMLSVSAFGAYQYGVSWTPATGAGSDWVVNLKVNNNSIKEYGMYSISASQNSLTDWVEGENFWTLGTGDNKVSVSDTVGFWVKKANGTYSSMSLSDYNNKKNPGFESGADGIYIYSNKHGNDKVTGVISIRQDGATGQPLPGALISLLIGGGVFGAGYFGRKLKRA